MERLEELKRKRDDKKVKAALEEIRRVAGGSGNLMIPVLDAIHEYATLGEICGVLREEWGEYREAV